MLVAGHDLGAILGDVGVMIEDYCGWAPLPPHAVYQSGVGFVYQGHAVSAGLILA